MPLTSALWSTAPGRSLDFPAAYAIRFFDNHGMLGFGRFRWLAVAGGSRTYVDALLARLARPRAARARRARDPRAAPDGVELVDRRRRAARASTASSSPRTPTRRSRCSPTRATDERRVLGGFAYTTNETVLHTDASFLPRTAGRPRLVELPRSATRAGRR